MELKENDVPSPKVFYMEGAKIDLNEFESSSGSSNNQTNDPQFKGNFEIIKQSNSKTLT